MRRVDCGGYPQCAQPMRVRAGWLGRESSGGIPSESSAGARVTTGVTRSARWASPLWGVSEGAPRVCPRVLPAERAMGVSNHSSLVLQPRHLSRRSNQEPDDDETHHRGAL